MKVLFINYEFPPLGGGGGTTSKYLAKELAKQGVEIKVLTAGFKNLPWLEKKDGYEVIRVKCKRKLESQSTQREMFNFIYHAIRPMFKIVDDWRPDIIQIFFAMPTGPLGWLAGKFKKTPYVLYLLGSDVPGFTANEMDWEHTLLKGISKMIWRQAAGVVANSRGLKNLGNKSFPGIKIEVITNGIDLDDFYPQEKKVSENLNLLYIGRIVSQKGPIVLLKALDICVNKYNLKNINLTIVGEGNKKEEAQDFIKEKNLEDKIKFLGWVDLGDLNAIYNSADVFVLPSNFEGMPSVVLQAMACGLPVVSTRVFGSEDLITDGKNGFLVDINDSVMMAEKIMEFIKHPERLKLMGQESEKMIKNYSWDKIANDFKNYYQTVL